MENIPTRYKELAFPFSFFVSLGKYLSMEKDRMTPNTKNVSNSSMAKALKNVLDNRSKEDGSKSVKETVIITPAAKDRLPARILLSFCGKKIKKLPSNVERPAKELTRKL